MREREVKEEAPPICYLQRCLSIAGLAQTAVTLGGGGGHELIRRSLCLAVSALGHTDRRASILSTSCAVQCVGAKLRMLFVEKVVRIVSASGVTRTCSSSSSDAGGSSSSSSSIMSSSIVYVCKWLNERGCVGLRMLWQRENVVSVEE